MIVHPREGVLRLAESEVSETICEQIETHRLTFIEVLTVLARLVSYWANSAAAHERRHDVASGKPKVVKKAKVG